MVKKNDNLEITTKLRNNMITNSFEIASKNEQMCCQSVVGL